MTSIRPPANPISRAAPSPPRRLTSDSPGSCGCARAGAICSKARWTNRRSARLAYELLADTVVETVVFAPVGDPRLATPPGRRRPGFAESDPCAAQTGRDGPGGAKRQQAIADFEFPVEEVRTFRKFWIGGLTPEATRLVSSRILANDSIEQVVAGPLLFERLHVGHAVPFRAAQRRNSGNWTTRGCCGSAAKASCT